MAICPLMGDTYLKYSLVYSEPLNLGLYLEETQLYSKLSFNYNIDTAELIKDMFLRYIDDGFILWPLELDINGFIEILNNLDGNIKYTVERGSPSSSNGEIIEQLNFLDILVILHISRDIEAEIFYKETNSHCYLDYNSRHPDHIKKNIPFNLAKRIIIFTSNSEKEQYRLSELHQWLINCNYPPKVIDDSFHKAKLQGSAMF